MRDFLTVLIFNLIQTQGSYVDITALSYNVWGLTANAVLVTERITSIAHHIESAQYDVVILQELWMKGDYDILKNITSESYYITDFKDLSGSRCSALFAPLQCSGLTILSKFPIQEFSFLPFSKRGSWLTPWDGEILVQKGLGMVQISPVPELRIDIFNTHAIAQDYNKYYRESQIGEAVQFMQQSDANAILLGGDINYDLRDHSETSYQLISQLFDDSYFSFKNQSNAEFAVSNTSSAAISVQRGNELFAGRETAHTTTNDFSVEVEPEILDYWFHKAGADTNIDVKDFKVFNLKEKILSDLTEKSCNNLFGVPINCEKNCSELSKVKQKCGKKFCEHPEEALVSLSDHEAVFIKYRISYREKSVP